MLDGGNGARTVSGPGGPPNTLAIGTVTTGAAGSQAAAQVRGTSPNQALDLTIPKGDQGVAGPVPWAPPVAWAVNLLCVASAPATTVSYGGETYVCVVTHLASGFAADLAAGCWIRVAQKGANGTNGTNGAQPWQTPPVPWAASTAYTAAAPASSVTYQGGSYICSTSHTSGSSFDPTQWTQIAAPGTAAGALLAANNLSDLPSPATARANLGLAASLVRQTVQTGPLAAGAPSFLTTSGTLTLGFQNVSPSSPLVLTSARGFGAGGAVDALIAFTANPSVTLAASATSFLFYDFDAGSWGSTTLAPIYQFGGTISTVNGQFTFDIQAMQGWVGNGSIAAKANRVFVGEAVTSASAVNSTIAYAYNGSYDSGWTNTLPAAATAVVRSHNLGLQPGSRRFVIENLTADLGYAVGDQIEGTGVASSNGTQYATLPIYSTRLTTGLTTSTGTAFVAVNKTTGGTNGLTAASWRYKFLAQRGW